MQKPNFSYAIVQVSRWTAMVTVSRVRANGVAAHDDGLQSNYALARSVIGRRVVAAGAEKSYRPRRLIQLYRGPLNANVRPDDALNRESAMQKRLKGAI